MEQILRNSLLNSLGIIIILLWQQDRKLDGA